MIIEGLNKAIEERETTRADVAKALRGLSKSALYRLLAGQGNTTLGNLDELLSTLGLAVVPVEHVADQAALKKRGYLIPGKPKALSTKP
jgi:DNA-binding phage protein